MQTIITPIQNHSTNGGPLVDKEHKILQIPCGLLAVPCNSVYTLQWNSETCGFRAIPGRFGFQNTKTGKESGNSCKIREQRMHCIRTHLEGIAVFLVRFCVPFQLGHTSILGHSRWSILVLLEQRIKGGSGNDHFNLVKTHTRIESLLEVQPLFAASRLDTIGRR